jgi:cell wall-associated NlpC family hydrolase
MKHLRTIRRAALLLAASVLLLAGPAAAATAGSGTTMSGTATSGTATSGTATSGTAWVRLAHLSPNTPAVDVYLYSFGNLDARVVLHDVAYGDVSGYLAVPGGEYSVAMRATGASATSPPVLSSSALVSSGSAYTVLAVGPRSGLRLTIFHDDLTTPTGKALVRVVQASMKHPHVTVSWGGKTIASKLAFASVTSYEAVAPGVKTVAVTAGTGDMKSTATLTAGSIHTLVVLDGVKGLEVANLEDADGSSRLPAGGAQTGFGGTAPHGPGSPLPWLVIIAVGSVFSVGGSLGLRGRRRRAAPRHALPSRA